MEAKICDDGDEISLMIEEISLLEKDERFYDMNNVKLGPIIKIYFTNRVKDVIRSNVSCLENVGAEVVDGCTK